MGRFWTAAGLILPIVFAAGTVTLMAAAAAREAPGARIELELAALVPLPDGPGRLLVLREKGGGRVLAIVVADAGALAPPSPAGPPRPPGGLIGRALGALGATVREVEIERAEETSTASRVVLEQAGRRYTVQARPSESVALALDAGAPIRAARALLDADGLTTEDLARARADAERSPSTEL